MKNLARELERYRVRYKDELGDLRNGKLQDVPLQSGALVTIVFSDGCKWDHVSVSISSYITAPVRNKDIFREYRCPTWDEMCEVKEMFFHPAECAIQYHPPLLQYRNAHPYCLHLWRPQKKNIPMPPPDFVGPE